METLEERKNKRDLITVYKLINQTQKVDTVGHLLTRAGENRGMRGQNTKLREG